MINTTFILLCVKFQPQLSDVTRVWSNRNDGSNGTWIIRKKGLCLNLCFIINSHLTHLSFYLNNSSYVWYIAGLKFKHNYTNVVFITSEKITLLCVTILKISIICYRPYFFSETPSTIQNLLLSIKYLLSYGI